METMKRLAGWLKDAAGRVADLAGLAWLVLAGWPEICDEEREIAEEEAEIRAREGVAP